jgi:hypothetical protein
VPLELPKMPQPGSVNQIAPSAATATSFGALSFSPL